MLNPGAYARAGANICATTTTNDSASSQYDAKFCVSQDSGFCVLFTINSDVIFISKIENCRNRSEPVALQPAKALQCVFACRSFPGLFAQDEFCKPTTSQALCKSTDAEETVQSNTPKSGHADL